MELCDIFYKFTKKKANKKKLPGLFTFIKKIKQKIKAIKESLKIFNN